jgi:hypothetical protein
LLRKLELVSKDSSHQLRGSIPLLINLDLVVNLQRRDLTVWKLDSEWPELLQDYVHCDRTEEEVQESEANPVTRAIIEVYLNHWSSGAHDNINPAVHESAQK